MHTIFVEDYNEMSDEALKVVKDVIETTENPVLNLNTGGTPRGLYKNLVDAVNNGLDLNDTTIFVLDEYMGPINAPYTVNRYMHENFLDLIETKPKEVFFIDGSVEDAEAEVERYKKLYDEHEIDFQLLGIGTNGHLGANEPGTSFDATMFLADHTESTIESTRKEYNLSEEETPNQMITLGMSEILKADKILLLISGKHKAETVKDLIEGEITPEVPATALRNHDNVTVIIDKDAASLLSDKK